MAESSATVPPPSARYGYRYMTFVYSAALVLIALLVSFGHWKHLDAAQEFHRTAELINRSGRQRMLSEKLVLLATRAAHADDQGREALKRDLKKSQIELLAAQEWVNQRLSRTSEAKRISQEIKLDEELTRFIALSDRAASGDQKALAALHSGTDTLLEHLNRIVVALESSQGDADLLKISTYTWGATLALLLAEALLIFLPLVRGIDRARKRLDKRRRELEVSNEQLQRFAYIASHDLKEPLRTVSTFSQLLCDTIINDMLADDTEGTRLTDETAEYLRLIQQGAARGERLVQDLLSYARISNNELKIEEVDLNQVVRAVRDDFSALLDETGGEIQAEGLPAVQGVHTQVRQIIQNLVSNAVKFSKQGVAPVVRISAEARRDRWAITVQDNGIGFDQKYADKILRPFQRLHLASEKEGTGIGLSVVDLIIKRHGGSLQVRSSEGNGAEFTFDLASAGASPHSLQP